MSADERHMREALGIALEKMRANEGGPFGAMVVKDGRIVGRGWNKVTSINDPTAHAEIEAIRQACQVLKTFHLEGCELYASSEPCPMCLSAIYWAHIDKLFFAAAREDAAAAGFDDAFIYEEFSRPPERRRLQCQQLLRDEALRALQEWTEKPDKVPY